jgi:GNAT superfamily N-acetyltransferase
MAELSLPSLAVREAAASDADAIARLCTQLGYPSESPSIPLRLERFRADPNARAFVALNLDAVVGLSTVHLRYTINHDAPIAQLTLLVVDEANRVRGVGRLLVEAAERFACERGSRRINVTTALERADAHAFYTRVGYRQTGLRFAKDFVGAA